MYAVDEGMRRVNGVKMKTFRRDAVEGDAWLNVEAGTTGFSGSGNRGGGGRTVLQIEKVSGDFLFKPILDKENKCKGIIIAGCGDDTLNSVLKSLCFCLEVLADQCCEADG